MGDGKTVKIVCATWDQVEAFYAEKLRGNVLVVKMPFRPGIGEPITIALGLPDGLLFAIDGTVAKLGGDDGGRIPVAIKLFGMTEEVRTQLRRLVHNGRSATASGAFPAVRGAPARKLRARSAETLPPPPPPRVEDVADEERATFAALAGTRRRLLALPAHDVLDVAEDADPATIREAFLARALRLHPDRYRRFRSPALRSLALETYLLVRRAHERLLGPPPPAFLVAAEPASGAPGVDGTGVPAPIEPTAADRSAPYAEMTLHGAPPPAPTARPAAAEPAAPPPPRPAPEPGPAYDEELTFTTSVRGKALTAEELFDEEDDHMVTASAMTSPPAGVPPLDPGSIPPVVFARSAVALPPATTGSRPYPQGPATLPPARSLVPPAPVAAAARPPDGPGAKSSPPVIGTVPPAPVTAPPGLVGLAEPPAGAPGRDEGAPEGPPPTLTEARTALAEGRFREACELLAAIVRAEPRNRQVRALYHVASGLELRQKGDGVQAQLQFETALAHDRECEDARRAVSHGPDKKGLFKRLFDR